MRRNPRPAPRSYTLIELIIVMALLALAAALLVPNLVGRDTMTLQAAVRLFIADLNFAQSDALANQEFRRVVLFGAGTGPGEGPGTGYCIIKVPDENYTTPSDLDDSAVDYVIDPLHSMGRYVVNYGTDRRFEGVVIESAVIDGDDLDDRTEITYDTLGGTVQNGGSVGTGGNVILKFNGARYQINIASFTGKLTVVEL
jgi:type II secretory pathway pseudopilin PulG